MSQSRENLRTDRRMDGQTLFYRTLLAEVSASEWWEYTKSSFKENAKTFSKNSTTQENIIIPRLKQDHKLIQKRKLQTRN